MLINKCIIEVLLKFLKNTKFKNRKIVIKKNQIKLKKLLEKIIALVIK